MAKWHESQDDEDLSTAEELRRIPGLVAEEVHDAGATAFVEYDEIGKPIGLMYDRIGVAWIPFVKQLRAENADLRQQVSDLQARMAAVEQMLADRDESPEA